MEEELFDLLNEIFKRKLIYCKPTTIKEASDKAVNEFKEFTKWKDDLHCPFNTHYNGEDPIKPKISYDRLSHNYTLEDVWQFWRKEFKTNL